MNLEQAYTVFKNKGYKLTSQRKIILNVLYHQKNSLLAAYDINKACNDNNVAMNLTTIYRNLELLEEANIVHKVLSKDGSARYQLNCIETHHHHLICKTCGKTEVVNYCPLQKFKDLSKEKSFTITDHKLEIYGYCKNCSKNYPVQ